MTDSADLFLQHLGMEQQEPSLDYLNLLIERHQRLIPFETITKLIDYERAKDTQEFLPPIEVYVQRIVEWGTGGTCWALARGFHWLLNALGFDAHFMYMDAGHLCVRVELDQPYYADVGYCAPLFRAYPLNQAFTAQNEVETFSYMPHENGVLVAREPGPTKELDLTPRQFAEFHGRIVNANQWRESSFLTRLRAYGYVDNVPTHLSNNLLRRYSPSGLEERLLTDEEALFWIEEKFCIDPDAYLQARAIHRKWMEHYGFTIL